ncbi:putative alpha,alpha-trehalase [Penicillium oxalicum 114-2]|uniref:alpha,alpha-trehalase n=1 Tax=Penicillium oxalicum (strain 114-2 / CGMCC 5302) TaxID=933388 RepID=S7ZCN9_PENO1|nr:putative alpha,alpha-trehalase [Penicillium oxalicum 114-2]
MQYKSFIWTALQVTLQLSSLADATGPESRVERCLKSHSDHGLSAGAHASRNVYKTDFDGVTWDDDNWLLTTTTLEQGRFQSRGSVANGYFGINVASVGPFFEMDNATMGGDEINGWPLFSRRQSFATISGFWDSQPTTNGSNFPWLYQYGGDSVISGIPHWSGIILELDDETYLDAGVDNSTISNFTSTYDFQAGVLSWAYQWTPNDKYGSFDISYRLFVNKLYVNQAVVDMTIVASQDSNGTIANVLDGYSAVRTDFVESGEDDGAIYSAVRPNGIANVTAYVYANMTGSSSAVDLSSRKLVESKPYVSSNSSSVVQTASISFKKGKKVQVTKFVGAASTDAFADPQAVAKEAARTAAKNGYAKSLRAHVEEWASVMPVDSVDRYAYPNGTLPNDNYIIDSAVIAVANTYYLLQNTVGKDAMKMSNSTSLNRDSIAVGGLTSDSYAGQVFWDADVWMQPGLVASHPEAAQRITNYRVDLYPQAKENIKTKYSGSKNSTYLDPDAAIYSWTSGRYGNCTATGPCWDYEYHLNGDIGLAIINEWVASGDDETFKSTLFPIYNSVATVYSNLVERNGSHWTLTNMTDPDEYANHVDAGGFTMPLIAQTLTNANKFRKDFGLEVNSTWNEMAENVLVLRENGVTLEFTTMNGSAVVKQADVVLNTYPLDYSANYTQQDSLNDLDYYANKQSPDGPAMTWAIFSAVANEMSPSGCSAYIYAQNAYKPYARAPFYQMSEQQIDNATTNGGTHPAFPFLTGHGGSNQVVLFGYLGLRYIADDILHVDPNLPPQIPYLKYRTFYWRGWPISAWSNNTHTVISRADSKPLETADQRFANRSITIHSGSNSNYTSYTLPNKGGSVAIPNRRIGAINTIPGNLIQCQPVQSNNTFEPGQFPIAINDGATSTKWQPSHAANLSAVTISLEQELGQMVTGFHFDWAQAPPINATIIFHNKSLDNPAQTFTSSSNHHQSGNTTSDAYQIISTLTNIVLSKPYQPNVTDLDEIMIPIGNTTNVTLASAVPVARYASLLIVGNQALDEVDVKAKNGTGATVAEWAIIGQAQQQNGSSVRWRSETRMLETRAAARLARAQARGRRWRGV